MRNTVLIVDDDEASIALLSRLLLREGYNVLSCRRGEETLSLLKARFQEVDLIILDVVLEDVDGYRVAELVKGNPETRDIPIIFISGFKQNVADQERGYEVGGVEYLDKPFLAEILLDKVKVHLQEKKTRDKLEQANKALENKVRELNRQSVMLENSTSALIEAQDANRKNNELLEHFFACTHDCIALLDRNFDFIRVNGAYADACRKNISEFPGLNCLDIYCPPDAQSIFESVIKNKKACEAFVQPFVSREHPEWETAYWDWNLIPVLDEKGEVRLLLFTMRDMTKRVELEKSVKRAREESLLVIHEAEGKYQRLLENIKGDYFFCSYGPDGIFTHVSSSVTDVLGYHPKEYLTYYSGCFTRNPVNQKAAQYFEDALLGKETPTYDVEIFHKDGSFHWLEVTQVPAFSKNGNVVSVEGIYHDITVQRRLQEEIEENEKRLKLILDVINDGLWDWNIKAGEVYRSPSWYKMLGYEVNDPVVGSMQIWTELIHPDDRERVLSSLDDHISGNTPRYKCEYRLKRKNGDWLWVIDRGRVVESDAESLPLRMVGAQKDVHERKTAEEKIQKAYLELEERVIERTRKLTESNSKLQEEVQKRIEAEKSSDRLLKAIETSRDAINIMTTDGVIIYANSAMAQLFGYERSELVGMHAGDLNEEKQGREAVNRVFTSLQKKGTWSGEVQNRRKDGSEFLSYANMNLYNDEKEEKTYYVSCQHDITEQKRIERELVNEKEKAQHYLDIVGSMVILVDKDQKVVLINKRGCEILGYPEKEVVGKSWYEQFLPADTRNEALSVFRQLISGEVVARADYDNDIINSSGEKRRIAWHSSVVVHNKAGGVEAVLSSGEDITEKTQAENALKTLFESMVGLTGQEFFDKATRILSYWFKTEAAAICELSGDNATTLSFLRDDTFIQGYQYRLQNSPCMEVKGKGFCVYSEQVSALFPDAPSLAEMQAEGYVGTPLRNKNHETIGLIWGISRKKLDLPPRTKELFEIIAEKAASELERIQGERKLKEFNQDLQALVKVEVDKRQKHEAILMQQTKMAAMGEMIGAISHQWRQPLNSLGLYIQDLEDAYEMKRFDASYLANTVRESMKQIEYMSSTIDDFRNFFKPSNEEKVFDLHQVVEDTACLLKPLMKHNFIALQVRLSQRKRSYIKGYPDELKQVFINILNNAKDSILEKQQKGLLPGESGLIGIETVSNETTIVVSISDNGTGIPEHVRESLFAPYFTTKEEGKGTGVGLYMAKMIVEEHMMGKLTCETQNEGALFNVCLPLIDEVEEEECRLNPP